VREEREERERELDKGKKGGKKKVARES